MRNRIVLLLVATLMFSGTFVVLQAQMNSGKNNSSESARVDLKTQTLVGKKLLRTEDGPDGKKIFHYVYRVQAQAAERDIPRFTVDPQFNISYKQSGFQEGDSVTLRSTNTESATDSPIWVYDVAYVGSGTRSLTFSTSGSVMAPMFATADGEMDPSDPNFHCKTCNHYDASQCTAACRCCCSTGNENCNCPGCQYKNPRCFACPVGCKCSHCVCSCDGCMTQNPRCLACPVKCTCEHCRCKCEENIDHLGRCGCMICKQRPFVCDCECHRDCR